MSDLTTHAEHARRMATAQHKPECSTPRVVARCWGQASELVHPDPACPGCVTDSERALWARIAAEIEAHLGRHEEAGLFG